MRCAGTRHCTRDPAGTCLVCHRQLCPAHQSETACKNGKSKHKMEESGTKPHHICESCKAPFDGKSNAKRCGTCRDKHQEISKFVDPEYAPRLRHFKGGW